MVRVPPGIRLAAALVSIAAISYAAPTRASTGPTCTTLPAGWSLRPVPTFTGEIDNEPLPTQDQSLLWLAPPGSGRTVLVTDGTDIERSTDYGCTWRTTLNVSQALTGIRSNLGETSTSDAYFVAAIAAPPYPGDPNRIYAFLEDNSTASGLFAHDLPTLIAESRDGGATWVVNDDSPTALLSQSTPRCSGSFYWADSIYVAPSNPDVLYVACATDTIQADAGGDTFRSTDGGRTWSQFTADDDLTSKGPSWPQIAIDPTNPNEFWQVAFVTVSPAVHNLVVTQSTDAGLHWRQIFVRKNVVWSDLPQGGIALTKLPGSAVQVLAWSAFGDVVVSTDDGKHWSSSGKSSKGGPSVVAAYFLPGSTSFDVWRSVNTAGWDGIAQPSCAAHVQLERYVGMHHVAKALGGDRYAGKVLDFVSQDFAGGAYNFQVAGSHPTVAYASVALFRTGGSQCKIAAIGPLAALPVGP